MKNVAIIALLTAMASIGVVLSACGESKPPVDPSSVDAGAAPTETTTAAPTDTAPAADGG